MLFQGPVGEVGGVRLPLQSLHGYGSVFMYSASTTSPGGGSVGSSSSATSQNGGGGGNNANGEVTLRLREPEDIPEEVLARLEDTATLSISLQGDAVLRLGAATTGKSLNEEADSFVYFSTDRSFYRLLSGVYKTRCPQDQGESTFSRKWLRACKAVTFYRSLHQRYIAAIKISKNLSTQILYRCHCSLTTARNIKCV